MNADKPPQIQGIRDKGTDDLSKKMEMETTMEQVSEMDLIKPVPVDEVTELADIATKPLEQTNEEASHRVKNRITEKQEAALAKARQAKKEKRAKQNLEGTDAAKGTPAPDMLVELNEKMERFTELLTSIKQQQDLIKIRGESSALQENHIVESRQTRNIPDQVQEEEHVIRPINTEPPVIPVTEEVPLHRTSNGPIVSESKRLGDRFRKAMNSMTYQNEPMLKRVRQNPTLFGSNQPNSNVLWF